MQILRKPLLQIVYRVAASYHRAVIQPVSAAAYHSTRIVVVGAGAFGGWTALELRRRGVAVTLVDAWGPGNARASSGGETRIIRATYGQRAIYTRMTLRALELWRDFDRRRELLRETGVRDYRATPGNLGAWLLRQDEGARTGFLLLTLWDRRESIAAFAGNPIELARYYDQDRDYLLDFRKTVEHFDVAGLWDAGSDLQRVA